VIQEAILATERTEREQGLIECLQTSDLFGELEDEVLEKIAALCHEEIHSAGTALFSEGDRAQKLYILREGVVAIRIQPTAGARSVMVQPIEEKCGVFGWSGLAEPNIYTASAVCATDVKVIAISGGELMALLEQFPLAGLMVMRKLAAIIGSRLRRTREHLTKDVHLTSYRF